MIYQDNQKTEQLDPSSISLNNEKLVHSLRAAGMGLWDWDMITNKVSWSDNVIEIFGVTKNQFDGTYESYLALMHDDDREHIVSTINNSIQSGKPYQVEHRIFWPDGSVHWLECSGEVFRGEGGEPIRMAGAIRDITISKRNELEKADWKLRYELVVASSGQVIYDYNILTGTILWSGNIYKILGYSETELGGLKNWEDHIHPDDKAQAILALDTAQKKLDRYDVNYRFRNKNGDYLFIHDRGFFIPDASGKAERMLGMMIDITKNHKIENELRESEYRFKTLQQASFGGIALHDKGVIIDCNQGLSTMTGYSREELIGMNGLDLISKEYHDLVISNIISGYELPYDAEGQRKDGARYFIEVQGKNVPYKGKNIRVTEFRDITDRKNGEAKIIEQNASLLTVSDSLRRKNNQLEEFTEIVSHNLRSPIGNVMSLMELLEKAESVSERKELTDLISRSAENLLGTLNELNDVLKIKNDQAIEKQDLVFENVLERVQSMLHSKIKELGAIIKVDFQVPSILYPNIYLESILLNLLSNALKYKHTNREPIVTIKTFYLNRMVVLSVEDNGLGIDLDRYGNQLFKLRKTFHSHPEGRGVGLFLVKNQIEAMGGTISASSIKNEGTTFTVNFGKQN